MCIRDRLDGGGAGVAADMHRAALRAERHTRHTVGHVAEMCIRDRLKAVPWTSFVIGVSAERYTELVQSLKSGGSM